MLSFGRQEGRGGGGVGDQGLRACCIWLLQPGVPRKGDLKLVPCDLGNRAGEDPLVSTVDPPR